jgi:hypothetical protein
MSIELSKECIVSVASNAVAAGVTPVNTAVYDMAGFDAISFICKFNTVVDTSVLGLQAWENSTNSTSGATEVTNGTASFTALTSSNNMLVVDVIRPKLRFVFATLTRTVANATVDSILALQYRAKNIPVTLSANVLASQLSTPEA